jgi:hypothetical protein
MENFEPLWATMADKIDRHIDLTSGRRVLDDSYTAKPDAPADVALQPIDA